MTTVQLPGGHTAELRDKVTVGGRELLREEGATVFRLLSQRWPGVTDLDQIPVNELDGAVLRAFHRFNRAAVVALVATWSLPAPKPTMDNIDDMDPDVYDVLAEAVAPLALKSMFGDSYDPRTAANPASPTVPSSDSNGGGLAATIPATNPPTGSSVNATSTTSVGSSL